MDRIKDFLYSRFSQEIRSQLIINQQDGSFTSLPGSLDPAIKQVLKKEGIHNLYHHQKEAYESITGGDDTLVVSHTASGKTLSFFLPILNEYLASGGAFSVLLLYPTKALSRDQEGALGRLMQVAGPLSMMGTFDGDTPREERNRLQSAADFIITNPDMLHSGVLPNHNRKWRTFLSRLKYIVVDEVHVYRGAFGSHVSNVFRRLSRVCAIHGSRPRFICSSATVGNPADHVRALFHREFTVIEKDTSPRPSRNLYFVNPQLVTHEGRALYRKGPGSVSVPLIREAVRLGIRTICFCRARQEAERLYRAVIDGHPGLADKIKPYRGGLLPAERRALERELSQGKLKCVISTNALELGIDIGDLELCILSGHPGTIASFWQQAGRVGRRGRASSVVYIAKDTPIDQFLVHHPEFITKAPVEQALLNSDNPYILLQHLPCMAHEHPLRASEEDIDSMVYAEALTVLRDEGTLVPYRENLRYSRQDYPAKGVNLRGMTDYNVDIYCGTEVIGEIDPIGARGTLYKDAIYQHLGRRYMSMDLDLDKKLCRVEPVDVDYYTEAVWDSRIEMLETDDTKELNRAKLSFGFMHIRRQPKLYKKIRERTFENIGYGPITLPPFEYGTTGFSLQAPKFWIDEMELLDRKYIGTALYGISYILHRTSPLLCMADVKDIDTDVYLVEGIHESWKSALFFYDAIEGGVGYAEKVYESIDRALELCKKVIEECECGSGCPSCVPPVPPGVELKEIEELMIESNASKACTKSLLTALLEGKVALPEVSIRKVSYSFQKENNDYDRERRDLHKKLSRASKVLSMKRERMH